MRGRDVVVLEFVLRLTNCERRWERPILAFGPEVFFDAKHTEAYRPILGIKELDPRPGVDEAPVPRDIVWPSLKYRRRFHLGRLREKILQHIPRVLTKPELYRKELLPIGSENLLLQKTDKQS